MVGDVPLVLAEPVGHLANRPWLPVEAVQHVESEVVFDHRLPWRRTHDPFPLVASSEEEGYLNPEAAGRYICVPRRRIHELTSANLLAPDGYDGRTRSIAAGRLTST